MGQLKDDLNRPLHKVKTKWLRRVVTIMLFPPLLIICVVIGVITNLYEEIKYVWDNFFVACWKGV